jgi:hypothetical protein
MAVNGSVVLATFLKVRQQPAEQQQFVHAVAKLRDGPIDEVVDRGNANTHNPGDFLTVQPSVKFKKNGFPFPFRSIPAGPPRFFPPDF